MGKLSLNRNSVPAEPTGSENEGDEEIGVAMQPQTLLTFALTEKPVRISRQDYHQNSRDTTRQYESRCLKVETSL